MPKCWTCPRGVKVSGGAEVPEVPESSVWLRAPQIGCLASTDTASSKTSLRNVFALLDVVLLMFTNMRKRVTMRAILPGTISTGMRNEMKDMTVSMRVGRRVFMK